MPATSISTADVKMNISAARSQKAFVKALPLVMTDCDDPNANVSSNSTAVPTDVNNAMRRTGTPFSTPSSPRRKAFLRLRRAIADDHTTAATAISSATAIRQSITFASISVFCIFDSFLAGYHFLRPSASISVMEASSICDTMRSIFVMMKL